MSFNEWLVGPPQDKSSVSSLTYPLYSSESQADSRKKSSPRQDALASVHDGASLSGGAELDGVPTEGSGTSGRSVASGRSGRSASHSSSSSRLGEAKMRRDLLKLKAAHLGPVA